MRRVRRVQRIEEEDAETQAWLSEVEAEEREKLDQWDNRYLLRRATVPELQSMAKARGMCVLLHLLCCCCFCTRKGVAAVH